MPDNNPNNQPDQGLAPRSGGFTKHLGSVIKGRQPLPSDDEPEVVLASFRGDAEGGPEGGSVTPEVPPSNSPSNRPNVAHKGASDTGRPNIQ